MLHEFLISHHHDIVVKCREKAAARFAPGELPDVLGHGVPMFVRQLIEALASRPPASGDGEEVTLFPAEIGRSAALHGAELLRREFTINLVVHHYGDICQAITEMAIELKSDIDPDDFRILNGCLDTAIAGAVTAFAQGSQDVSDARESERSAQLSVQRQEHGRLVEIAIQAFTAMRAGSLGLTGPTGELLTHALAELQALSGQPDLEDKSETVSSFGSAAIRG